MTWDAFTLQPACHFIFLCVYFHTWLCPLKIAYIRNYLIWKPMYNTRLCSLQPVYKSVRGFPLKQLTCHMQVSSINSRVHIHSTLKIIKTWLMDICWALIINQLNCLNLLDLWNFSIFQSINRGLEEAIDRGILERKFMLMVYLQKYLEQQNSDSFGCRGVLVSGVGLYTYLIHYC